MPESKITLLAFKNTSAESLVKGMDFPTFLLPSDKEKDTEILLPQIEKSKNIICLGQKPGLKNKLALELLAKLGRQSLSTNFDLKNFEKELETNNIPYAESHRPGTSFCNLLYWNGLKFIKENNLNCRLLFIHLPFLENMGNVEELKKGLERVIKSYFTKI